MAGATTCGFCGTSYDASGRACPKCSYPADGASFVVESKRAKPQRRRKPQPPPPETCANCGDTFPAGRPACPHCGADAQTGWKSPSALDEAAATLPEFDDDDYRAVVEDVAPDRAEFWRSGRARRMVIGILLVLAMTVPALLALRYVRWI